MEITPETRTITQYTVVISAEDAALLLDDPYSFSERLRDGLLPHVPAAKAAPKPGRASQITLGKGRTNHKPKAARKVSGQTPAPGSSLEKIPCFTCEQLVARKFMARHVAVKHGPAAAE